MKKLRSCVSSSLNEYVKHFDDVKAMLLLVKDEKL